MKKLIIICFFAGFLVAGGASGAQAQPPIKIGYVSGWVDNVITSHIVANIIKNKMHKKVKLIQAAPGIIFQGLADGSFNILTAAALPATHKAYYQKVASHVIAAGPIYRLQEGWAVPDYVPKDKVNTFADLKSEKIKKKFDGRIVGIDEGAGLMKLSKVAMKKYGLKDFGYRLISSSGPAMTASLKKAIEKKKWIIVTAWKPHWMFARWHLRFLEPKPDKGVFDKFDEENILVNYDFPVQYQNVYEMLARVSFSVDELGKLIYEAEQSGSGAKGYVKVAEKYIKNHPARVNYWVTGKLPVCTGS